MEASVDFKQFRSNVGVRSVLTAVGMGEELKESESYAELKHRACSLTDDEWKKFVKRVRSYTGYCRSGEGVLLAALLYRLGHDELADKLDRGRTWRRMYCVSGEFRAAVAACIDPEGW